MGRRRWLACLAISSCVFGAGVTAAAWNRHHEAQHSFEDAILAFRRGDHRGPLFVLDRDVQAAIRELQRAANDGDEQCAAVLRRWQDLTR